MGEQPHWQKSGFKTIASLVAYPPQGKTGAQTKTRKQSNWGHEEATEEQEKGANAAETETVKTMKYGEKVE